jgi:hypothetical protein
MYRPACIVLVLSLLWPVISPAQTTLLVLESEPDDYIGGGRNQTFTLADGTFNAMRNFDGGVSIAFDSPDLTHWWFLDFAAPSGVPLTPGVYEGATRFPFQEPDEPGLDVSGEGRGCNMLTGRFEVFEVRYGPGDTVLSFAASFEQHCEGATPALFGSILFNSGAPVPPALTLTLTGCTSCNAGDRFAVSGHVTNPGNRAVVVEVKVGVRLPDGTAMSLLGDEHLVVTLPPGFDATFPLADLLVPAGLATGAWHFEGTLLEVALGRTFDRDVRVFEINP